MSDKPTQPSATGTRAGGETGLPPVVERHEFQAKLDRLRVREKAHTREGDAIETLRVRLE